MPAGWIPIARRVGGWALRNAPTWLPTAKRAASGASDRLSNRQKAISHATQIDGEFSEVWFRERRHWVVRKGEEIVNAFPASEDEPGLERAASLLRPQEWRKPDELRSRKTKERVTKLRRRGKPDEPPSSGDGAGETSR